MGSAHGRLPPTYQYRADGALSMTKLGPWPAGNRLITIKGAVGV